MTRDELEHIIRASAAVTNQYEFVIVGSQSILGQIPHPEPIFTMSAEADIYPLNAPELANEIDGAIGEGSKFHETYGYYAQGVGPETAVLPGGWWGRVHRVQSAGTNGRLGYTLDVTDLFMSKAAAGREKDRVFCMALLEYGYVKPKEAVALVDDMPLGDDPAQRKGLRSSLRARIRRWVKALRDDGKNIPND